MKKERVLKVGKWTSSVFNSNEKRIKKLLTKILPEYKNIDWDTEKFKTFFSEILNSLPARYKQKNSIELNGRIKDSVLEDAIREKLDELSEQ